MELFAMANRLYALEWNPEDIQFFNQRKRSQYLLDSVHIALEQADTNKDWEVFKHILNKNKDLLTYHIKMSHPILHYNVYDLPKNIQDNIFN